MFALYRGNPLCFIGSPHWRVLNQHKNVASKPNSKMTIFGPMFLWSSRIRCATNATIKTDLLQGMRVRRFGPNIFRKRLGSLKRAATLRIAWQCCYYCMYYNICLRNELRMYYVGQIKKCWWVARKQVF